MPPRTNLYFFFFFFLSEIILEPTNLKLNEESIILSQEDGGAAFLWGTAV